KFGAVALDPEFQIAAVRLHNVIRQTQPQTGSFAGGFCGEKWLEYFVFDRIWNPVSVVFYTDDNTLAVFFCRYRNRWLVIFNTRFFLLVDGVKGIGDQV